MPISFLLVDRVALPTNRLERHVRHEPCDVRAPVVGGTATAILRHQHDRYAAEDRSERSNGVARLVGIADYVRPHQHDGERGALLTNHSGCDLHSFVLFCCESNCTRARSPAAGYLLQYPSTHSYWRRS